MLIYDDGDRDYFQILNDSPLRMVNGDLEESSLTLDGASYDLTLQP